MIIFRSEHKIEKLPKKVPFGTINPVHVKISIY